MMEKQKEQAARTSSAKEKAAYVGLGGMAAMAGVGVAWATAGREGASEQELSGQDTAGMEQEQGQVSATPEVSHIPSQPARQAEEVTVTAVQTIEELEDAGMEVVENDEDASSVYALDVQGEPAPEPLVSADVLSEEALWEDALPEDALPDADGLSPDVGEPLLQEDGDSPADASGWMDDACGHMDDGGMALEFA